MWEILDMHKVHIGSFDGVRFNMVRANCGAKEFLTVYITEEPNMLVCITEEPNMLKKLLYKNEELVIHATNGPHVYLRKDLEAMEMPIDTLETLYKLTIEDY